MERTNAKTEEMIIGIHIPMDCKDYWDYLIAVHQKLPKDKMIIYIGDLNTYMPGSINNLNFPHKNISPNLENTIFQP